MRGYGDNRRAPRVALAVAALALTILTQLPVLAQDAPPPPIPSARPLDLRLIDALAPFFDPDRAPPRSWSMPFAHMDRTKSPYVDEAHLARAEERFLRYCDEVARLGYNAVWVGNLIHLATFDGLSEGRGAVYSERSPYRARHERYKALYRRLAEAAHARGLSFAIDTDFPAYTPDLARYVVEGGKASDDVKEEVRVLVRYRERAPPADHPRLFAAYRAALAEVFDEVGADMVQVRIGEGGGAYDEPLTGYASTVAATSVESARRVVDELLRGVEAANARDGGKRRLLARTWTIGIGALGNLHASPALYEEVFRPFAGRPALVAVMKHVGMDFFEHVPRNPTIGLAGPTQIVEMQARREYELFGAIPAWKGRAASEDFAALRAVPGVVGISVWPTSGGFLWPARTLWGVSGNAEWIDANVTLYARLAQGSADPPEEIARRWALERGGATSEAEAREVAAILSASEEVVRRGLYVGAFARSRPRLPGLDVAPTMLWLYWDRPVAGWGVQALVYRAVRDDPGGVAAAVAEGEAALEEARALRARAAALPPSRLGERLVESLDYLASVLEVMGAYRAAFLHHMAWAETGEGEHRAAWLAARPRLREALDRHRATYAAVPHLPPLDGRELFRMLREDEVILHAGRAAWALAALCLAAAAALALPAGRPRSGRGAVLRAALAALLLGLAAATLLCGHEAPRVIATVAGATLLALLGAMAGLAAGSSSSDERTREGWFLAGLADALPLLAPPLALAGWLVIGFARRGPAPLWIALADALHGTWPMLRLLAPLAVALVATLVLAWMGTAPGSGPVAARAPESAPPGRSGLAHLRRAGAVLLALALASALLARVFARDLPRAVLRINEATRAGPSILGEAGTGVGELMGSGER